MRANLHLEDCTFDDNHAAWGAGMYAEVMIPDADAPVQEGGGVRVETARPDENHWLHYLPVRPDAPLHPLVVGTGPAGLMAAYLLALHGRKPLVLEVNGGISPEAGAKLRVQRGEDWHDAVVVDSAPTGAGRTIVFTVARAEPDLPAQAVEFGGETYGCATI